MKRFTMNVGVPIVLLLSLQGETLAADVVIPDARFFGSAIVAISIIGNPASAVVPVTGTGIFTKELPDIAQPSPSGATAKATASVITGPKPSVSVMHTTQTIAVNAYLADATAEAALTYSFAIVGGSPNVPVSVSVTLSGYASAPAVNAPGNYSPQTPQAYFIVSVPNPAIFNTYGIGDVVTGFGAAACLTSRFCAQQDALHVSILPAERQYLGVVDATQNAFIASFGPLKQTATLLTNTVYNVTLVASSGASISGFLGGGSQTDTAWIDPVFEIDPASNPSGIYSLAFSNGIVNGAAVDTIPPVLSTLKNITVDATSPVGATVNYTATATDDSGVAPTVNCIPLSGGVFAIGKKTVNCSAKDAAGNSTTGSFTVTVNGAIPQLEDLVSTVGSMTNLWWGLAFRLEIRLFFAYEALNAMRQGSKVKACAAMNSFVRVANAQTDRKLPADQANLIIDKANRIRAVLDCR